MRKQFSAKKLTTTDMLLKYHSAVWLFWLASAYIKSCFSKIACGFGDVSARVSYPDYEDPFNEGEAKAWDGPVASRCRGGEAERQEETNPVEQERH